MNDLTVNSNNTMTSLEIAELTDKKHFNVLRDIKNILDELKSDCNSETLDITESTYKDSLNRNKPMFILDRIATDVLLTGYSVIARTKVIKRWKELESKHNEPKLPQNYIEALKSLVVSEEQKQIALDKVKELENINEIKTEQLKIAEPKLQTYEIFFKSNKYMSFLEYSKTIYDRTKMGRNKLMNDLRNRNILLKTNNLPSQKYIDNGSFKVFFNDRGDPSTKLTRKGVEFLNSIYLKDIVDERYNLFNLLDNDDNYLTI